MVPCTRRRFLVSASILVAAGAAPLIPLGPAHATPRLLISAERADPFASRSGLVLAGPRVERLQAMTDTLAKLSGEVILRLDPVDDQLLDIAAQTAGVSLTRGSMAPDGRGIRAHVSSPHRSFV